MAQAIGRPSGEHGGSPGFPGEGRTSRAGVVCLLCVGLALTAVSGLRGALASDGVAKATAREAAVSRPGSTQADSVAGAALSSLPGPEPRQPAILAQGEADPEGAWAVFLPLVGRRLDVAQLPRVPTALPPTTTPTASATPTQTATPEATPTPTLKPTPVSQEMEEDDPRLTWSGSWRRVQDAKASGRAYMVSATEGDSLSLRFEGSHIAIYRRLDTSGGRATVKIDGRDYTTIEFYFPEPNPRYQVPAVIDGLPEGEHQLLLAVSRRKHSSSSGTNVYIDAIRAPSPYEFSDDQLAAGVRSNSYRDIAGLPRLRLDRAICLAAQAHAEYDARHQESHTETAGKPGFTGARPGDRLAYFGYDRASFEVMHFGRDMTRAVDGWMATVYHRLPFMDYRSTDCGAGYASGSRNSAVMNFGSRFSAPPPQRLITTYPADGQQNVPISWSGGESPDPLPGAPKPVGYPVSLHIAVPASQALALRWPEPGSFWPFAPLPYGPAQWHLTTATLTGPTGQLPSYVLDQASDPNKFMGANVVFVIAKSPMAANSTYTAHITGRDSQDRPFDHRWSFTTGAGR